MREEPYNPTQDLGEIIAADLKEGNDYPTPSLVEKILDWRMKWNEIELDPFKFVEPCEPGSPKERQDYCKGQFDMATKMEASQQTKPGGADNG